MKITEIETLPVHVPLKPDVTMKTAHGRHVVSPYVLVQVPVSYTHLTLPTILLV